MPSGGIFRFGRVINWWKIISITDTLFVSFCYYCPWATLASVFHTPPGWPKRYIFVFAFLKEKKTLFRWTRWQTSSMQRQTFFLFTGVVYFCSFQCFLLSDASHFICEKSILMSNRTGLSLKTATENRFSHNTTLIHSTESHGKSKFSIFFFILFCLCN